MIERVSGVVLAHRPGTVVIDVAGFGLEVQATARAQAALSAVGERVTLLTRYIVREDAVTLFGFADGDEREGFDRLLQVAGVGPRLALATVSTVSPGRFRSAIASGESDPFLAVPGVGKKLAQRIVLDLREWAGAAWPGVAEAAGAAGGATPAAGVESGEPAVAVEALVGLGYGVAQARSAVAQAARSGHAAAEDLVREGLRHLAQGTADSARGD